MAYSSTHPPQEDITSFLWDNGPGCLSSVDEVNTSSSSFSSAHSSSVFSRDVSQHTSQSPPPPFYFPRPDDSATQHATYASSASSCPSEDDELPLSHSSSTAPIAGSLGSSFNTSFTSTHTRTTAIQYALSDLRSAKYIPHNSKRVCTSNHRAYRITLSSSPEGTEVITPKSTQRTGHADEYQLRQSLDEIEVQFPTYELRVSGGIATKHQIYKHVVSCVQEYLRDWASGLEETRLSSLRVVVDSHSVRLFVVEMKPVQHRRSWSEEEDEDEGYAGETEKLGEKDLARAIRLGRWNEVLEDEEPSYFEQGFVV